MPRVPIALTIAGSDSGGGAGIQADLKTFSALGVYGASVITAVTAQNTLGVRGYVELPPAFVAQQIDAVLEDIGADAVKTGMLASADIIEVVAERLRHHEVERLVVDPVMRAKSGDPLLKPDAVDAMRRLMVPLATVVTPNIPEAETLVGYEVRTPDDAQRAARDIVAMGARSVVVKGGHLEGPADDLFFDGHTVEVFSAPRIDTRHTHGTGCTFASAIAAHLARGLSVVEAVRHAKTYITEAIAAAYPVGRGHGPVHHFYRLWSSR